MKKAAPLILVIILAGLLFVVKQCKHDRVAKPETNITNNDKRKNISKPIDRDKGFDRRIFFIEYSNHAKCRMQCRKISQAEVEDIMQQGKINYNKSDLQNARCPRYALEGITSDDQKVRIVFAQCNEKTEVVTVIDLDTDWTCSCPGDDKKFGNKN